MECLPHPSPDLLFVFLLTYIQTTGQGSLEAQNGFQEQLCNSNQMVLGALCHRYVRQDDTGSYLLAAAHFNSSSLHISGQLSTDRHLQRLLPRVLITHEIWVASFTAINCTPGKPTRARFVLWQPIKLHKKPLSAGRPYINFY